MQVSDRVGEKTCPACGRTGYHLPRGKDWRCADRKCRTTFRMIGGKSVAFEEPKAEPKQKTQQKVAPLPRDRRFIPRRKRGAKLRQTQRENALKCSGCHSQDVRPVIEGESLYMCRTCHAYLRLDRNLQFRRVGQPRHAMVQEGE